MKVAPGLLASKGMTLIEVLITLPILFFIAFFLIKTLGTTSKAVKNVRTTEAVAEAKTLSTQKLSSTSSLKEAIEASLPPADFLKLSACLSGSGENCKDTFGSSPIPLQATGNIALNSYLNTQLSSSLAQCPNNDCGKLAASINTELSLSCESSTKCSNAKLIIRSSQLDAMSTKVKSSSVELPVSINDFKPNALRGICSSNEAYVSSINYADNSIECEPAPTQSLPTEVASNDCSADSLSADGKTITTGLKSSTLGSNDCQSTPLVSWNQATAYPSPYSLIPSLEEVLPVAEPDSTQIKLAGEIIIIMDDSGSMAPIRSQLSDKLKDVLSPFKGSDIRIRVFSTDTFESWASPNVYYPNNLFNYQESEMSKDYRHDPKAPLLATFRDIDSTEKEKKRVIDVTLNEPKLTLNTTALTQEELNGFSTQLENLPIISNREVKESPITTMMRIIEKRNEDPNFIDQNRKVIFLFFTDEDDQIGELLKNYNGYAQGKFSKLTSMYSSFTKSTLLMKELFIYYLYQKLNSSNLIGTPASRADELKTTYVPPSNAILKTYTYFAPTVTLRYWFKIKGSDGVQRSYTELRLIIDPREFNIPIPNVMNSSGWYNYIPTTDCNADIKQRLQEWASNWVKHERNGFSNYYQTIASDSERESVEWADCRLEYRSSGRSGATQEYGHVNWDHGIIFKNSFSGSKEFHDHDPFDTNFTYQNKTYSGIIDFYQKDYYAQSYYGSYVSPEMLTTTDSKDVVTNMRNASYVPSKAWKDIFPPELVFSNYYSSAPDKDMSIGVSFEEPSLKEGQYFTKTPWGLSPYRNNHEYAFESFAKSLGYEFDPVQNTIINEPGFSTIFKSGMDLNFGSNFKLFSFVPKAGSSCPDNPQESAFFKDIIDKFDTTTAKRYELCDFDSYDEALEDVVTELKTYSEVASYNYNVTLGDSEKSEQLKNFLNSGGKLEDIPLQVTLLNPTKLNSPNPHTLNSEHYTFSVDTSGSKVVIKITFIQSPTMRTHLLNYKNIKVNILTQ